MRVEEISMNKTNENDNPKIRDLKLDLFAILEAQAVLTAQHAELEKRKAELAKALGEARQAAEAAADAR